MFCCPCVGNGTATVSCRPSPSSPVAGSAWGAGTLYALLERFEKDGLIRRTRTEDNRKYYILMPEGERTLQNEYERIKKQAADMERVLQKEEES